MSADPFNLARFVSAQDGVYQVALAEIMAGDKRSHWMWFIFPQLAGLGTSSMAQRYALAGIDEAAEFLAHPVLGPRLIECCRAILKLQGKSARQIFGSPDDLKLRSSMTLFARVPSPPPEFQQVLDKYFAGEPDKRTLSILADRP
jgi:uncharacterized protein (DUF1810 family)